MSATCLGFIQLQNTFKKTKDLQSQIKKTIMAKPLEQKEVFNGNEGEIILADTAKKIKDVHQKRKDEIVRGGKENYVEAEFFGLNKFNELIKPFGDKCVGFRVYYGNTHENHKGKDIEVTQEGKGKRTARSVIVPVDKFGNDLRPAIGPKDAMGSALANGPLCPTTCQTDI